MVLSMLYAMLVFFVGLCCYVADIMVVLNHSLSEIFNIYVSVVGLLWMVFLQIDIGNYIKNLSKYWRVQSK